VLLLSVNLKAAPGLYTYYGNVAPLPTSTNHHQPPSTSSNHQRTAPSLHTMARTFLGIVIVESLALSFMILVWWWLQGLASSPFNNHPLLMGIAYIALETQGTYAAEWCVARDAECSSIRIDSLCRSRCVQPWWCLRRASSRTRWPSTFTRRRICWLPFARLVRAALRAPVVATTTCTAIEQLA